MSGTLVLLELAGQVGLLLWGSHMVSTGMQRGFGTELRCALERTLVHRWQAFLMGLGITTLLQSSTATGLMATSFTAAGVIALAPALAVMLGANVGTALVAQVLAFNVGLIAAPLVLIGVLSFRWSSGSRIKNLGRVAIGLGLMLMALAGLQHMLGTVENTPLLRSILQALGAEPFLAILVASLLTWGCHSSVAIVLLVASLEATHVVGATESLALVLGANIGGALPALFHASTPAARRLPFGNLLVRIAGAIVVVPWLPEVQRALRYLTTADGELAVSFHLTFNLLLAIAFLPSVNKMAELLLRWLPDLPQVSDPGRPLYLESAALDSATVALANATRETLRMADMAESMLRSTLELFRSSDRGRAAEIPTVKRAIRQLGSAIRGYLVAISSEQTLDDAREGARLQEILSAVVNIEHASDIVANGLVEFAVKQIKRGQVLSAPELGAITAMHTEVLESLKLAMAVFLHGDQADARRLVKRKVRLRQMEAEATALSVQLLREAMLAGRFTGNEAAAAEESGALLRIVRDLRRVHSYMASFAYPITQRRRFRSRTRVNSERSPETAGSSIRPPSPGNPPDMPGDNTEHRD